MLLRIYCASVKQLRLLHHHAVSTIKRFLFWDSQRLHPPFVSLTYCREPKVQGSFKEHPHNNSNLSQGPIMHEEEGHITESNGEGKGEGLIVGSFLNFGNIKNGLVVDKNGGEKGQIEEEESKSVSAESRAEAMFELVRKLKEMVMEDEIEENLVDIQEFLYFYSQISSPFFTDMVDRFFADIFG